MTKLIKVLAIIIGIIPAMIVLAITGIATIVVFGKFVLLAVLIWIIYQVCFKEQVQKRTKK